MAWSSVQKEINLNHAPTVWNFINDPEFCRIIIGPVGSGKSTGAGCAEIMRLAMMQEPGPDNVRYFKAGIVRNTYGELISTTLKTWRSMFPEELCGRIRYSAPITHQITIAPRGGMPGLNLLVEFIALDKPKDVKRLLSWEGSVIWFNELREIEKPLFDAATARVGRYPSEVQGGVACTRPAIIGDTNPPDEDHWLYEMEMEAPMGYSFFRQPPAVVELTDVDFDYNKGEVIHAAGTSFVVNPDAENLPFLPVGYYQRMLPGKNRDWIRVYAEGKYGYVMDGKPVVPEYDDDMMSRQELPVLEDKPLLIGVDIGGGTLQPAATIAQRHSRGTWLFHAEVVCHDMGLDRFSDAINQTVAELFPGRKIDGGFGDPAGATRDEIFEVAGFQHLRAKGITVRPAATNSPKARIEAWRTPMGRLIDGQPGLLIHKRCKVLRSGLSGKWRYRRMQISGSEIYAEAPDKVHPHSDVCDAGGYLLLGGGEDRTMRGRSANAPQQGNSMVSFDVFG